MCRASITLTVWGFLWPHYLLCLWDRQEDVILGVWNGQSQCGVDEVGLCVGSWVEWELNYLRIGGIDPKSWLRRLGPPQYVWGKKKPATTVLTMSQNKVSYVRTQKCQGHIICVNGTRVVSALVAEVSITTNNDVTWSYLVCQAVDGVLFSDKE